MMAPTADASYAPEKRDTICEIYDLSMPIESNNGLRKGLTSYGDAHFCLFLRKVFIKAFGYSEDAPSRPIIGVISTYSGFSSCHGSIPQLIEAAKRDAQLHRGL
jgi:dihydroxy-acid dehydratase